MRKDFSSSTFNTFEYLLCYVFCTIKRLTGPLIPLFKLMNAKQKKALFENTARAIGNCLKEIKIRHIRNCLKAHF